MGASTSTCSPNIVNETEDFFLLSSFLIFSYCLIVRPRRLLRANGSPCWL